jgi:hypothetical protein
MSGEDRTHTHSHVRPIETYPFLPPRYTIGGGVWPDVLAYFICAMKVRSTWVVRGQSLNRRLNAVRMVVHGRVG